MMEGDTERYSRHLLLPEIGEAGQRKLHGASVLVIGCGGLGCPALQYLTAVGVGRIGIVDADVVSVSNLQRQILFGTKDVGRYKVEVAKEKLSDLNPNITFDVYPEMLTMDNAEDIISRYDLVLDCCDNFPTRFLIGDVTARLQKPLVFGSIYQFEGQVSVFNYQQGPSYRDLFPEAPDGVRPASDVGVLGVLPGVVGAIQATEVVKIITGAGEVLSGKLLMYDALKMNLQVFRIKA
ncbi:HesA/MoeB/ThiF family protein [Parabacteroides sp. FAFU027]|uniref:HesA/MoeB/ThiF family protein n=1 Tax=Parabacteroides sp. FAFU027 TaxID=2922715 RepID=UPI001FAFB557|nr:HesA/MoeB/ThiF family protein [Parabacteroides sp. FAFU027]